VKNYFEDTAKDFDEIYDWISGNQENGLKRIINNIFRKGMKERFILTLQECEPDKTTLDIGCGSGRITLYYAAKGAKVIGIDYSSKMIDLANEYLRKYRKIMHNRLNISYLCYDFLEDFNSKEKFDVTLALGVFDYIKDPIPFLKKMKILTKEKMIASYPAKLTFQMPIRKIWLATKRCPVYFYTEKMIDSMYKSIGINHMEIIKISAGYFVKAYVDK
jgi:2-polyprenyl-3-methyl-5-hydroxy-6-metoxy-1,4-benzoquinol methylase